MATKTKSSEKKTKDKHPSADSSSRFSTDEVLRRHGFTIHARPKGKEAIWTKNGVLFGQQRALWSLDENEVADAQLAEECEKTPIVEEEKPENGG